MYAWSNKVYCLATIKRYKCSWQSQFTYSHTEFNMPTQCSSAKHADQGGCPRLEEHPGQEVVFFGCRLLTQTLWAPPDSALGGCYSSSCCWETISCSWPGGCNYKESTANSPSSIPADWPHLEHTSPPFLSTSRADSCTMSNIWFSFTPKNQNNTRRRGGVESGRSWLLRRFTEKQWKNGSDKEEEWGLHFSLWLQLEEFNGWGWNRSPLLPPIPSVKTSPDLL